MLGKNVLVSFCSSFLPGSFQCGLWVLRISKKKKTSRHNISICMQQCAFFFFFFTPYYQPWVRYFWSEVSFHITAFCRCLQHSEIQEQRQESREGKETQLYSHICSAPSSGMPRTVPPPQHKGTGPWPRWGGHLSLQSPRSSSSCSSGCFPTYASRRSR